MPGRTAFVRAALEREAYRRAVIKRRAVGRTTSMTGRGSLVPASPKHDRIAERIAKKLGVPYSPSQGPDIRAHGRVVEVEVDPSTLEAGIDQVRRYTKDLRYIATPKGLLGQAKDATGDSGVGVMDENANVVKSARRPGQ